MSIQSPFRKKLDKDERIIETLDEIELELKFIGFWSENPPDFKFSYFTQAPSFELWLQCIFIPNARDSVNRNDYPERSQVGLMALSQYDYYSYVKKAQKLVSLLNKLDKISEGY